MDYFYDGQIRRFITQFIRMMSNYQVEFGQDRNGNRTLQRVPVYYGDPSRQAAMILRNNSENTLNAVPAMAVYISGFTYDRPRLQNPTYVGKLNLRERYYVPETGQYTTTEGDVLTVERLMPVPYKLTIKLDIWTSNTNQKLQLLEQICVLFNPALEIQSTDNYIDWTSITYVLLTDTTWSSRSVPVGSENPIDITTLTFELPIFISAPALVKKLGVVQKIIASIFSSEGNIENAIFDEKNLVSRQYLTPLQYGVILLNNELRLVAYNEPVKDPFGTQIVKEVLGNYPANITIALDDTDGIRPNMVVTGLNFRGNGSITCNTNSNIINGVNSNFVGNVENGAIVYYNTIELGTVANVVSNNQLLLASNAAGNISSVGWNYTIPTNSGNCIVLSTNGDTVTASNLITANIGDRLVFSSVVRKEGKNEQWRNLVNIYGNLINGSSQVSIELDDGNEVVGTVAYSPVDDTVLLWTPDVDTIPANTLPPINAIIDPQSSRPNKDLQELVDGTRYLLVNDYFSPAGEQPLYNWMGIDDTPLRAVANDIIQFNGQHWVVIFDSRNRTDINYVTNLTTGTQYHWDGSSWTKSYEGYYEAGKWQLII